MKRLIPLFLMLCLCAGIACAETVQEANPATLTAVGTAQVEQLEHYTLLTLGLRAEAETVTLAHQQLEAMRETMLKVLAQMGIAEEQLNYTYYDVESVYDYHHTKMTETQLLKGFIAQIAVQMRLEDSLKAGLVVDAVHTAGLDCESELSFESEALTGAAEEAIAKASEDAKLKAQALAQAFQVKLGSLVSVQQTADSNTVEVQVVYTVE